MYYKQLRIIQTDKNILNNKLNAIKYVNDVI